MKRVICSLLFCLTVDPVAAAQSGSPDREKDHVAQLIQALHAHPWPGPLVWCSPMCWDFNFTPPMEALLKIGATAQDALLANLSDQSIVDQVVILLGGVGDERSVGPIIETMQRLSSEGSSDLRRKVLWAGNAALTNITVADVIWHHGGGLPVDRCPGDPAGCWAEWWRRNKATFRVSGITQSRNYSNYPNYGIYRNLP